MFETILSLIAGAVIGLQGVPEMKVLTYNAHLLPCFNWFGSKNLRGIENRTNKILAELPKYDVALIQEDFMHCVPGYHAGWFPPTGLTFYSPEFFLEDHGFKRYKKFGWESGDWLTRKGFQWVDQAGIRFYNTHLDAGDGDARVRRHQLRRLLNSLIRREANNPLPTIVAGDFNPETEEERAYLFQEFQNLGFVPHYVENKKMKDFIFTKGIDVKGVYIDMVLSRLSDHPAIWIEF
jgi:hypothetical protein